MLSIGDFARLAGVSVRMLRHYDALGLLPPVRVDPSSGYRSYSAAQLGRANRLVALKELGFSLEECGRLLADDLAPSELRGMLRLRQTELAAQIEADQARLAQVERRLRMIEKENVMSSPDSGKPLADAYAEQALPALRVVRLTARVPDQDSIGAVVGPLFGQLDAAVASSTIKATGPAIGVYSMADGDAADADDRLVAAAAYPVGADVAAAEAAAAGLELAEIAAESRALVTTMRGAISGIGEAWQALSREVEARGLAFDGPCREVYHVAEMDDPDNWVVELQQPVA